MRKYTAIYVIESFLPTITLMRHIEQQEDETIKDMLIREQIEKETIFLFRGHLSLVENSGKVRKSYVENKETQDVGQSNEEAGVYSRPARTEEDDTADVP